MANPADLKFEDLFFGKFFAASQKTSDSPVGCMVLHKPTQRVGFADNPTVSYLKNRDSAFADLLQKMGLPPRPLDFVDACPTCKQRTFHNIPDGWKWVTTFTQTIDGVGTATVYEVDDEDGRYFDWSVADEAGNEMDFGESTYSTASMACKEASKALSKLQVDSTFKEDEDEDEE